MINELKIKDTRFYISQFQCPCCGHVMIDPVLFGHLILFEHILKEEITITSAFRCNKYNKQIGGYSKSYHKKGKAFDLTCRKLRALVQIAQGYPQIKGIGFYPHRRYVHISVRHDYLRWITDKKGELHYFRQPINLLLEYDERREIYG